MPWCPKCRVEYREGFIICGDCGANLMDQLPPLAFPKKPEIRFDTESFLMTVSNEAQASIIESLLRSFNIPTARNYREAGGYVKVFTGTTIYGIDICVPTRYLEKAREIVKASVTDQGWSEEKEDQFRPSKGTDEARRRVVRWIVLIVIIITAILTLHFELFERAP